MYNKCTGYLSYGTNVPMEYTVGNNVALKVKITNDSSGKSKKHKPRTHTYQSKLNFGWFYNNTVICVGSCSSHYILSHDSKTLTIVNASAADVGSYEARVTSYDFYGYDDKLCDRVTNELLEYHAVFAPVTYTLSYKSKAIIHSQ